MSSLTMLTMIGLFNKYKQSYFWPLSVNSTIGWRWSFSISATSC